MTSHVRAVTFRFDSSDLSSLGRSFDSTPDWQELLAYKGAPERAAQASCRGMRQAREHTHLPYGRISRLNLRRFRVD